ncbi:MAG: hypothetical protein IBX62_06050 [Coriobacteriia bacterium]|nr:hypothetical protein [Coriobacteriia bacterium]
MHRCATRLRALAAVAVLAPLLLTACRADPRIRYIPDGGTYTMEEALRRMEAADTGAARALSADEVPEARQAALAALRSIDASASALADLITSAFPFDTRSVPVLAEAAMVDGSEAWILVEAWGGREGALTSRRVWVLDRASGGVVSSATGD